MISGTLPQPLFSEPAEDYSPSSNELECENPPVAKTGVKNFATFVRSTLGGRSGGIERQCTLGIPTIDPKTKTARPSGHYSGRAWDWMMDSTNPEEAGRVQQLLDWLTANDAEIFRRAGLAYIIWNRKSFSSWSKEWRPSTSYSPHTDHVHFSFGVEGANGNTSFFRWLGQGMPSVEPVIIKPPSKLAYLWILGGAVAGITLPIAGDYLYRRFSKSQPRKSSRRA